MHQLLKLTPLLLGAVSLSACSALGFGAGHTAVNTASASSGQYTQTASNHHMGTVTTHHANTTSGYNNSGWYATPNSPYAGGQVELKTRPVDVYPTGQKMTHNGYHDAHGNPVHGPTTGPVYAPGSGPMDTTYVKPTLRGNYGPSYYGNIGGIMYDVDDDIFGVIGRLGAQKSWYGAELEGSFGVIDEDLGDDVDAGIDYSLAAFAVGRLPISKRFGALARVGYHTTQVGVMADTGDTTVSASQDFDGVAYGAGLEYDIDGVNGLRLDYTRYNLEEDVTADSLAATYLRRF